MQTRIHKYTHIHIHSKHIMNLGLPYFDVVGVGAYGDSAPSVGAHDVGVYGAGAPNAGAPSVGAPGVDALDAGAHVVGFYKFGAQGKTPFYKVMYSLEVKHVRS